MTFIRAVAGIMAAAAVTVATAQTAVAQPQRPETVPVTTVSNTSGVALVGNDVAAVGLDRSQPAPVLAGAVPPPDLAWVPGLQDMLKRGVAATLRNGDRSAPVLVQVASPQENRGAMQNFSTVLGLGTGIGSLLGVAGGAVVGCVVGGIVIPVIGCLPGLITGASVGGILGTVTGGGIGAATTTLDLVKTLNAPDGTTRYLVKPELPAGAAPAAPPAAPAPAR